MSKMNRRDFIVISSAAVGAAGTALGSANQEASKVVIKKLAKTSPFYVNHDGKKTATFCEMCFWKCAAWVEKDEEGKPWKVTGNEIDHHCYGRLCTRGSGGLGSYLDEDRLKRPMIRVGKRGEQKFKEVSWDEAFSHIAKKLDKIKKEHGPEKVALFNHGTGGVFFKTLLKGYGTQMMTHPSYAQCRGPRDEAFKLTFGESVGSPERTDLAHSKCIVLMGAHIGENLHNSQVQDFGKAIDNRATIITVDPRFSVAASKSKYWLPLRPGTDMALVLAWINVLIEENIYCKSFVKDYCIGFDELTKHVKDKTPEWAYPITNIKPEIIRATAREMAKNAPASLVHPSRHVAWYGDDTQRLRSIAILNALLGNWGEKGGFYMSSKLQVGKYPHPPYPKPKYTWFDLIGDKFPFASTPPSSSIRDLTIEGHFKSWFVCATNLMQSLPDPRQTIKAIEQLDLLVVIDTMPAEITGWADVILPECTYLERYDELRVTAGKKTQVALRSPAFEAKWDTKPAWWIAKNLANKMGLEKFFPWTDIKEYLNYRLKTIGSSIEEMEKIGVKEVENKNPIYFQPGEKKIFKTPSKKVELFSKKLQDYGFDPLPNFTMPDQPEEGYYRLIYGRAPAHTFGKTVNNPILNELMPENVLWMNPQVAKNWGIKNKQRIKLKNQDGILSDNDIEVMVTERIRNDAVYLVHGFGHRAKKLSRAHGAGIDDQKLCTNIKVDPVMGATSFRTNFVTFELLS
ncbi:MAG: nitrate reductase [Epsilonproteobacteria bacterium]|nr:MAG: nitrate reductase [Campylobacterota bacterium]RLA66941.1 MAG: nitrate reductase [Campylobacterota bacterium]